MSSILPTPVSSSKQRRVFRRNPPVSQRQALDILLTRARVTNLGLIILSFFAALSFIFNLSFYFSHPQDPVHSPPKSILSTLSRSALIPGLNHLIIVPGHSIWTGSNPHLIGNEDEWMLEPYQKGGESVSTFVNHISRGAELALNDERSLLVFSGGQTRYESTTTEAESYLRLALSSNLLQTSPSDPSSQSIHPNLFPFPRATSENHALDSFQNLLFSIARFHEYTGRWPEHITVVGYELKRKRFEELHREAVRWPMGRFTYVGIDGNWDGSTAQEGEYQNAYKPYTQDMYGCHSTLLSKRRSRNPFSRFHSYYTSSPELRSLFDWCPDVRTRLFEGPLPWDSLQKS